MARPSSRSVEFRKVPSRSAAAVPADGPREEAASAEQVNNPFTTVTREDVGIELTVTPHVYDNSEVRMEVAQNRGEVRGGAKVCGCGLSRFSLSQSAREWWRLLRTCFAMLALYICMCR